MFKQIISINAKNKSMENSGQNISKVCGISEQIQISIIKKALDFQNKTTYVNALLVSQIGYFVVPDFENLRKSCRGNKCTSYSKRENTIHFDPFFKVEHLWQYRGPKMGVAFGMKIVIMYQRVRERERERERESKN